MKRWGSILLSCSLAMSLTTASWANQTTTQITPPATNSVPAVNLALPQPPVVAARAYMLLDVNTGQVLAQSNADMPVEPASLTKLMTAYLVFEALKNNRLQLDQTLIVSARARHMIGSRMFVEANSQVLVEDLIKGMIVQSGNDATIVLAEGVGGTVENFVALMNQKAQQLGMRNTTYLNPEGLDTPGHLTTARDLATLSIHLMRDFPNEYQYYSIKEFTYQPKPEVAPIPQTNRNRLLFIDPTVDGLKTGHTDSAGFCLVSSSARVFPNLAEKRRLLSVLLGAESDNARTQESQKLLNWGFQAWDDIQLFAPNTGIVDLRVWKGSINNVQLGAAAPIIVSVPHGMANQIKTSATYTEPLIAPMPRGQQVGSLKVTLDTPSGAIVLGNFPLVTLKEVKEAGFFGRTWDAFRLWIK